MTSPPAAAEQVRTAAVDGIVTPEAVVLELETAGVASRVVAGALDFLIQLALLWALALIVVLVLNGGNESAGVTVLALVGAAALMGYPVVCELLMHGSSPGKRAVGLRVVTLEGAPIRFRHAMLRMMGRLVDLLLPPGGITGVLFILGSSRHQRVGDLLAGTIVIRDPVRTPLPPALWFPVPYGLDSFAATIDPTPMTVEQYTVVRGFLMRVNQLTPAARASIAADLAAKLQATLRHTPQSSVHPEQYLLCAIARFQRRNFPEHQPAAWR